MAASNDLVLQNLKNIKDIKVRHKVTLKYFLIFSSVAFLFYFYNQEKIMQTKSELTDNTSALSQINVVYSTPTSEMIAHGISNFSDKYGFAFRLSKKLENESKTLIQLYRTDIKLIGTWDESKHIIELFVSPSLSENVQEVAINQGVNGFKNIMQAIKGLEIN
jgi:hypothetical protein